MFDYQKAKKEKIPCNLCGASDLAVIARKAKGRQRVNTCMCRRCGLIFISPRMTKEEYDNYYKYFYRDDRTALKGKPEVQLEQNFENARRFGKALARRLKAFLKPGLAIDIGSSTGGILYGLREEIPGMSLLGIEPSVDESEFANKKGVKTITALFESLDDGELGRELGKASSIFCVQSLNHLLDPKKFLRWSFDHLEAGGLLVLAVKDFRFQARRSGKIEGGVQIDHPYMFTQETLSRLVEIAGFKIVYLDVDEGKPLSEIARQREVGLNIHHIRLAAVKPKKIDAPAAAKKFDPAVYRKLRREFSPISLKLHYIFKYSGKLAPVRRLLGV